MSEERDTQWRAFAELGAEEVRKRIGAHQYSEERERLAHAWLSHDAALRASEDRRKANAAADEANELARNANAFASKANELARAANSTASKAEASARRTASSARTSNKIAAAALIAAIVAMIISVIKH